jgi:hypothetical protein
MSGTEQSAEVRDGTPVLMAAVALAVTVLLIQSRFADEWGALILFVVAALPAALVGYFAVGIDVADRPPAWLSGLYAIAFGLTAFALLNLADALGASDDLGSGAFFWVGAVLAAAWGGLALTRSSGVSALLAAAAAIVSVVAFIDLVFDPDSLTTFRYVLLVLAAALLLGAIVLSTTNLDHATALADVAGLAAIAVAATFAFEALFGGFIVADGEQPDTSVGMGWELAILSVGLCLAAFAALYRVAGPGWIGAAALVAFALLAEDSDDPSLIGWPIVLIALTGLLGAYALQSRPAR